MNKVLIVFMTKNGSEVFGTSAAVIINYNIGTISRPTVSSFTYSRALVVCIHHR